MWRSNEVGSHSGGSLIRLDEIIAPPRVAITLAVWQKMIAYARNCPVEVNGLGVVECIGNDLRITDAFTLPQTVSAVSAEFDDDAFHAFLYEYGQKGGDIGALRFQWHSHVDMPARCSSVDIALIRRYPGTWMVSMVVNRSGEYQCRLDIIRPFRVGLIVEPEIIVPAASADVQAACAAEIARNVRRADAPWRSGRLGRFAARLVGHEPLPETAIPTDATTTVPPRSFVEDTRTGEESVEGGEENDGISTPA